MPKHCKECGTIYGEQCRCPTATLADEVTGYTHIVGSWVAQTGDCPCIGRVKEVYPDDNLIDVVLYSYRGDKIGRGSPPLDGPKGFEPCCSGDEYRRIVAPGFPLQRDFGVNPIVEWA